MQARQAELEPEADGQGGAVARHRAALARAVLERAERGRGLREAPRRRPAATARRSTGSSELYVKRRAYKPLYDLLAEEADSLRPGPERRELWTEMAKLAAGAPRHGRPARWRSTSGCSTRSRRRPAALDALEKQAERDKDFATVAEVLERRAAVAPDDADAAQRPAEARQRLLRPAARPRQGDERVAARARHPAGPRQGAARAARQLPRRRRLRRADASSTRRTATGRGSSKCSRAPPTRRPTRELKIDLSFRCAPIYVDRLDASRSARSAPTSAILSVRPDDARAAAALVPLYEKDEKWGRLPALYEILLGHAEDVDEQARAPRQARPGHRAPAPRPGRGVRLGAQGVRAGAGARRGARRVRGARRARRASGPGSSRRSTRASRPSSAAAEGTRSGKKRKKKDKENGERRRPPRGDARPAGEARRGVRARDGPRRRGGGDVPLAGRGRRERRARRADAGPHPARVRPPGRPAVAVRSARRAREHGDEARAARASGRSSRRRPSAPRSGR